jgi:hypothetical protein
MDKTTWSSAEEGTPAGLKIWHGGSPATLRQHFGLAILLSPFSAL